MEKTGFWSSGGNDSQDRKAGMGQHTSNQPKPVGQLDTIDSIRPQNMQQWQYAKKQF